MHPGVLRGPGLPGLDVAPLQIEQGQPLHQLVGARQVKLVGSAQHVPEVGGVALLSGARLLVPQPSVGVQPGQVVEAVALALRVPLHQAVAQQRPQGVLGGVRLQFPHRRSRQVMEGAGEDRQGAPPLLQLRSKQVVAQAESGVHLGE